jgi:tRNA(Arg) A34 adenosine deaminase TadA
MSGRLGRVSAQLSASSPAQCVPCAAPPMPSSDEIKNQMARCIEVAKAAGERGDGPYGCTLVDAAGNVLFEAGNTENSEMDPTGHAETNLVRDVMQAGKFDLLATSTMFASTEPCTMCCTVIYRSGCPRIVYAMKGGGKYGKPATPAGPMQRAGLSLGSIHDTMATGNKHTAEVIYAGEEIEEMARANARNYEPLSYPDRVL